MGHHRHVPVLNVVALIAFVAFASPLSAQDDYVKAHYTKVECMIPMRDGVKLFTAVYLPRDTSQTYPIMLNRTPYSIGPYGEEKYRALLGPSSYFDKEGFIFVYQDVRGKFKSEGTFEFMRPHKPNKKTLQETDESSDTYDTIEWLVKNIPSNNGRVGVWGISYPGFQAAMAAIDAHPALKAVSPQAPMADVFTGDDFHHNGAFFLVHAFRWLLFTSPKYSSREVITRRPSPPPYEIPDSYEFFLNAGPLSNIEKNYFKGEVPVWNEFMEHGTFDEYWKSRNILPHLNNITPAIMTVGGWFDSEDKYGAVHVYHKIEESSPSINNTLVFGPWHHGGWARIDGDTLGNISFSSKTSLWYREHVEFPFFMFYLKDKGPLQLPEATAFMTGANEWKSFDRWPPKEAVPQNLYLRAGRKLSFSAPPEVENDAFDEYVSDPNKPVPFTAQITNAMGHLYMVEDQRFARTRPDVLVYQTEVLTEDITIAGPVEIELYGSTSGTDCDWTVKLIDVYPPDAPDPRSNLPGVRMGGFQMKVVSDVLRSKFRQSLERPEPMTPGKPTKMTFELSDKLHRFLKGHKIMVQIQSTWFPLVDRNPGKFVDIYKASEADFQKTTQRVYRSATLSSHLKLNVLK